MKIYRKSVCVINHHVDSSIHSEQARAAYFNGKKDTAHFVESLKDWWKYSRKLTFEK